MLTVRFQVFSFASKKVQGFSIDRKTLQCLSFSDIYKTVSQFFEILVFSQDI